MLEENEHSTQSNSQGLYHQPALHIDTCKKSSIASVVVYVEAYITSFGIAAI